MKTDSKEPVQVKLLGDDGKPIGSGQCHGKAAFALSWQPKGSAGASIVVTTKEQGASVRITLS